MLKKFKPLLPHILKYRLSYCQIIFGSGGRQNLYGIPETCLTWLSGSSASHAATDINSEVLQKFGPRTSQSWKCCQSEVKRLHLKSISLDFQIQLYASHNIDINMPKTPTNKFPWIKVANGRVMQEIQFCLVCLIFALISAGSGSAQGAPNTLSHPQGKKFRPVNQMWIEYIKDIRQVTIYRAKSFQLETGVGKTGGAHDRGMKRLFTPCYDHLQSCASTFLLSSVHTLWKLFSLYGPVKDAHYEDTYYVYLLLRPLRILCKPFFLTTEDRTSNKRYCTTCFLQCDTLNSGHSFTHWILNKHTYLCLQLYVQCTTCICTALIQQQCVHGLRLVTTPLRIFVVTWNSPSSFSATSGYLWVTNFWQKHHRNLLATFLNLFYGNP